MIRLVVAGAAGKMGRMILSLAFQDKSFDVMGGLEHSRSEWIGHDLGSVISGKEKNVLIESRIQSVLESADVLIDFTHPSSMDEHLKACVATKTAYVLGTTGLDEAAIKKLKKAASKIAIVQSPNMSIGVNLLFRLTELVAGKLDDSYDLEISEIHHKMKKDSPSGTAMKLLEIAAQVRGKNLKKDVVYGREGELGARPRGEIGVLALRGGDVVGDHTVYFFGDGERIELTHKASSRSAFAQGALRAAKFVAKKKQGFYTMQHVLGL